MKGYGVCKVFLEGRSWHKIAQEQGFPLRESMSIGKIYLYQLYTSIFVEFNDIESAKNFRKYMDYIDRYWSYDPVALLDTNDKDVVCRWKDCFDEDIAVQCQDKDRDENEYEHITIKAYRTGEGYVLEF